MSSVSVYSAVAEKDTIKVFNATSGIKAYSIHLGNDRLANGPVITGDALSFVTVNKKGEMKGRVYNLNKGILKYSFNVK